MSGVDEAGDPEGLELLMYASRSAAEPAEVEAIVAAARRRNPLHGLTGVLLYSGGHFLQVLEGPAAALRSTLAAIESDPRHRAVTLLLRRPAERRRFGRWGMALVGLDGADALIHALLAAPPQDEARALRLLARIEAVAAEADPISGRA